MRTLRIAAVAALVAVALVVAGGILGRRSPAPAGPETVAVAAPADLLTQRIDRVRERLDRVPGDWPAWADLGLAYVDLSRVTADPGYYPKAEEAVRRSLAIRPDGNEPALVAQGALANARHDFVAARQYAMTVTAANPYHADAYAVLADAETQLGNADAASDAVQRLLDLRPGLSAYARASYDLEQRGATASAQGLMRRALTTAVDRNDIAFCRVQLGDLALAGGQIAAARVEYEAALAAEPTSFAAQRGLARAAGLAGDLDGAALRYADLTARVPTPGYLLEYAEVLRAAGRTADADVQLGLARAAHELFVGNGGIDGLTGAAIADASGRPVDAVREAEAEWARRQHADVADTLAWALHRAGRDAEAWPLAQRALATGARSATYHYHAGMIRLALGDAPGARSHLTSALDINPSFSVLDAPAARQALAQVRSA
jgi:tetratricopeptide (TPR) repeat protein